jgi:hypothetical protein
MITFWATARFLALSSTINNFLVSGWLHTKGSLSAHGIFIAALLNDLLFFRLAEYSL